MSDIQSTQQRTCLVRVEPYLAQYARMKFDRDRETGGIRVPDSLSLYHCIWHAMAKWPRERWQVGVCRRVDAPEGNLLIHLPNRRRDGGTLKDPRYWNYISPRSARAICCELKRLFDWEFHHYIDDQLATHPSLTRKAACLQFMKRYRFSPDMLDTLTKNLQRREQTLYVFAKLKNRKKRKNRVKITLT